MIQFQPDLVIALLVLSGWHFLGLLDVRGDAIISDGGSTFGNAGCLLRASLRLKAAY